MFYHNERDNGEFSPKVRLLFGSPKTKLLGGTNIIELNELTEAIAECRKYGYMNTKIEDYNIIRKLQFLERRYIIYISILAVVVLGT